MEDGRRLIIERDKILKEATDHVVKIEDYTSKAINVLKAKYWNWKKLFIMYITKLIK